jgi:hypothetical protein
MAKSAKSLIDHVEKYLGRIDGGWTHSPEGEKLGFQVVKCLGGRVEQARAFCTVGLSNFQLRSHVSDKLIRQELLILLPESCEDQNIPAVLQQLGNAALDHKAAFLCGEIIERSNPIFRNQPFYAFVAAVPALLPDDFSTFTDKNDNDIVFAWMVPITKTESDFVRREGWSRLEDIFIDQGTDLLDINRESAI